MWQLSIVTAHIPLLSSHFISKPAPGIFPGRHITKAASIRIHPYHGTILIMGQKIKRYQVEL